MIRHLQFNFTAIRNSHASRNGKLNGSLCDDSSVRSERLTLTLVDNAVTFGDVSNSVACAEYVPEAFIFKLASFMLSEVGNTKPYDAGRVASTYKLLPTVPETTNVNVDSSLFQTKLFLSPLLAGNKSLNAPDVVEDVYSPIIFARSLSSPVSMWISCVLLDVVVISRESARNMEFRIVVHILRESESMMFEMDPPRAGLYDNDVEDEDSNQDPMTSFTLYI